jgi:hypothetical protein
MSVSFITAAGLVHQLMEARANVYHERQALTVRRSGSCGCRPNSRPASC